MVTVKSSIFCTGVHIVYTCTGVHTQVAHIVKSLNLPAKNDHQTIRLVNKMIVSYLHNQRIRKLEKSSNKQHVRCFDNQTLDC